MAKRKIKIRFKVGDRIRLVRPFLRMRGQHIGAEGEVLELKVWRTRTYGANPTHYLIKWNCYKIAHEYMLHEIDHSCELINNEEEEPSV